MLRGEYRVGLTGCGGDAGIYVGGSEYDGDTIFFNEDVFMLD
jgi:hypothetical protein